MNVLSELLNNKMIICPVIGWTVAQVLKVIINYCMTKELNLERLIGSGGMPSSHSATVCALATSTLLHKGVGSFEFAVTLIFALVVMYDAMNVRMETGKQAIVLNLFLNNERIRKRLEETSRVKWPELILKEYVGHTPLQVFFGALLGIAIGIIVCEFC